MKKTPILNSIVTKKRQRSAYFLIELVPKASLAALFFHLEEMRSLVWCVHSRSPVAVLGTLQCVHFRHCYSIRKRWSSLMGVGVPICCPCLFRLKNRMCVCPFATGSSDFYWVFGSTLQPSIYLSKHPVHLELPGSASIYDAKPQHTLGRNA